MAAKRWETFAWSPRLATVATQSHRLATVATWSHRLGTVDTCPLVATNDGWLHGVAQLDIHEAARTGDYALLKRAIAYGCPVDQLDDHMMTPLALASQSPTASVEILRLLIDSGANPNLAITEQHKYAIGLAAARGEHS